MANVSTEKAQGAGIEFGDWKLLPMDDLNWELCHRHESTRGKNKGKLQWQRLGRFYSYNNLENALLYAADVELKDKVKGDPLKAIGIIDALAQYRKILQDFLKQFEQSLSVAFGDE